MRLLGARAIDPVTDNFVSMTIGNTLLLKACGFITDQQAAILDVDETMLRLRVGAKWLERLSSIALNRSAPKPLEILLNFRPVLQTDEKNQARLTRPINNYCIINVEIQAISFGWTQAEFEEESRRMIWMLRSYFMAC